MGLTLLALTIAVLLEVNPKRILRVMRGMRSAILPAAVAIFLLDRCDSRRNRGPDVACTPRVDSFLNHELRVVVIERGRCDCVNVRWVLSFPTRRSYG